jgi:hypothetical protein
MPLLPYALRPRTVVRKSAFRRGPTGDGVLWKAASIYFSAGPVILRSRAMRLGFSGGNRKWQAVAVAMLVTHDLRRILGKKPEQLGSWRAGTGDFVKVTTMKPMSKKDVRRSGATKKELRGAIVAQAVSDTAAKRPDAKLVVKTK